jgi:hypothetical protein
MKGGQAFLFFGLFSNFGFWRLGNMQQGTGKRKEAPLLNSEAERQLAARVFSKRSRVGETRNSNSERQR